ncbi:MAG: hypothetical protein U9R27_09200 [Campylobacterota bacterium]|nr:hypothetical protein [Campylobacterota bacterium]
MSWNYKKIVISSLLTLAMASHTLAVGLSENQAVEPQHSTDNDGSIYKKKFVIIEGLSEDEWIIRAIWLEENHAFLQSGEIYNKLYEATAKKEYLFKEVSSSIYSKSNVSESLKKLKTWSDLHPEDLTGRRLLLALYMNEKSFKKAEEIGTYLLKHSDKASDLELAANPYLFSGNYKKGIELLNKLYRRTKSEPVLLRIAAIQAQYLKDPKRAIQILETHRRIEDASPEVYKLLLDLYVKEQNLDQVLEVYEDLYEKYPQKEYLGKIIEIYLYNRNFSALINFLELTGGDDDILYDLYKKEKHFKKAKKLCEDFYLNDRDPKWLAEKAILVYEAAEDKNDTKMLEEVVSLFDEAILLGVDDSIYLNYYGYTLIDKELDIERGLEVIAQALEQQPDNSFYLDSQAWGYFKKGECLKAYNIMKKVVEREGLDEPEIKDHWDKIRECQKQIIIGSRS